MILAQHRKEKIVSEKVSREGNKGKGINGNEKSFAKAQGQEG